MLRVSQMIVSPIMRRCIQPESKVFQNSSQSTAEYRKLWRGFCKLSKNYWRRVIQKQNPNSRCNVNYGHQRSTKTWGLKPASQHHCEDHRREGWNPRLNIIAVSRRRVQSPRLTWSLTQNWKLAFVKHHFSNKTRGSKPALSYNCPHYWVNYCPRDEGVNPHCGAF